MAPIKRGASWYANFWYVVPGTGEHRRCREVLGKMSKAEAIRRENDRLVELTTPPRPVVVRKEATFGAFAAHWFEAYAKANLKPSTLRGYETTIRVRLVPFFATRDVRAIGEEDVQLFKAQLLQRVGPKTCNNTLGVLSVLMRKAVAWGYADVNPTLDVRPARLPPQEFAFLDATQAAALLEYMRSRYPQWYPIFFMALRTGLRQGELIGLEWGDVDLVTGQVFVRRTFYKGALTVPKGGRGRVVPLTPETVSMLKAHRHLCGPVVFCRPDGSHTKADSLPDPLERALRAVGLPRVTFHDLRHSFASQLAMAGVPLKAVQEYLGHTDVKMTMRYAHLAPEAKVAWLQVLDGVGHKMDTKAPRVSHSPSAG